MPEVRQARRQAAEAATKPQGATRSPTISSAKAQEKVKTPVTNRAGCSLGHKGNLLDTTGPDFSFREEPGGKCLSRFGVDPALSSTHALSAAQSLGTPMCVNRLNRAALGDFACQGSDLRSTICPFVSASHKSNNRYKSASSHPREASDLRDRASLYPHQEYELAAPRDR